METLEQKLERIRKFGMNDVEIFDNQEEEIQALMAQVAHLERNLSVAREGLEEVVTISNLNASGSDCGEMAEIALANTTLRPWRKGGYVPLQITVVDEEVAKENIDYFGKHQAYNFTEEEHAEWIKRMNEGEQ